MTGAGTASGLVVAVDRTPATRSAYAWARAEARSRHGTLQVLAYAAAAGTAPTPWRPDAPSPARDLVHAARGQTLVVSGGDPDLATLVVRRSTVPVVVVPREWRASPSPGAPVRLVVRAATDLVDVSGGSPAGAALAHALRHESALVVHPTRTDPSDQAVVLRLIEGWRRRFPTVRVSLDADRPASAERFAAHHRAALLTVIGRSSEPCLQPEQLLDPRVRALLFYGRSCVMVTPRPRTAPSPSTHHVRTLDVSSGATP